MPGRCNECGEPITHRRERVWGLCDDHLGQEVKTEMVEDGQLPESLLAG